MSSFTLIISRFNPLIFMMQNKHFALIYCFEFLVIEGRYKDWRTCFSSLGLNQKLVLDCIGSVNGTKVSFLVSNIVGAYFRAKKNYQHLYFSFSFFRKERILFWVVNWVLLYFILVLKFRFICSLNKAMLWKLHNLIRHIHLYLGWLWTISLLEM